MIDLVATDLREAFDFIMGNILWNPEKSVDLVKPPAVYSFDNFIRTQTCDFDLDLRDVGLTKNRWTRFLTQYVTREGLEKWLLSIGDQNRGIVNLLRSTGETRVIPSPQRPGEEGHRWGVCFLGIAFRKTPNPRLTLFSRTARLPTTGTMELTLASLLAKEITEQYSIKQPVAFTWFCSAFHVTAYDVLCYLTTQGKLEEFISEGSPLGKFVEKAYNRLQNTEEINRQTFPYARQRRVATRVKQINAGGLAHCQVQNLSLWKGNK